MDTDIDWHHEIDDAIGCAPDRPVTGLLTTGRRAVRRRRLASATAGLAAATLIGGATWAMAPGTAEGPGEGPGDSLVATQPTVPAETPSATPTSAALPPDQWLRLAPDGEIVPDHPSVEIVRTTVRLPTKQGPGNGDGRVVTFSPSDDYEGHVHLRVGGEDKFLSFWKTGSDLAVVPDQEDLRGVTDFQQWTELQEEKDPR